MDQIYHFITQHANIAPWIIFGLFLLAGMNIPISIDILIIMASILSATLLPHKVIPLFLACLCGCYFSAWIAYWIGRLLGKKFIETRLGKKLFPKERLEKIGLFYARYGFLTLLIGRFIPFGIRNGIFMSSGMARSPFMLFLTRDILPCTIWTSSSFFLFHSLGTHFDVLIDYMKIINISLFSCFAVALISYICYKRKLGKKNH